MSFVIYSQTKRGVLECGQYADGPQAYKFKGYRSSIYVVETDDIDNARWRFSYLMISVGEQIFYMLFWFLLTDHCQITKNT